MSEQSEFSPVPATHYDWAFCKLMDSTMCNSIQYKSNDIESPAYFTLLWNQKARAKRALEMLSG